ncbi:MAG: hypothetical protein V3S01_09500, partial [Dehalococcoidia bacterium]
MAIRRVGNLPQPGIRRVGDLPGSTIRRVGDLPEQPEPEEQGSFSKAFEFATTGLPFATAAAKRLSHRLTTPSLDPSQDFWSPEAKGFLAGGIEGAVNHFTDPLGLALNFIPGGTAFRATIRGFKALKAGTKQAKAITRIKDGAENLIPAARQIPAQSQTGRNAAQALLDKQKAATAAEDAALGRTPQQLADRLGPLTRAAPAQRQLPAITQTATEAAQKAAREGDVSQQLADRLGPLTREAPTPRPQGRGPSAPASVDETLALSTARQPTLPQGSGVAQAARTATPTTPGVPGVATPPPGGFTNPPSVPRGVDPADTAITDQMASIRRIMEPPPVPKPPTVPGVTRITPSPVGTRGNPRT